MKPDDYRSSKQSVTTPHGKFTYLDVGDGPPTVFIHGLFMSGYFWHRTIDALKDDRRCVAYNLPFHGGGTVADDQPLDLTAQADMLAGFCDALGLEAFDLVANDTGGAVAQAFAVAHPHRVNTLSLTNCEACDWMPSKTDLAQLIHQLAQQGQLAAALVAAWDDLDTARRGPMAEPYEHPERLSDDEIRTMMEPHQATLEGAQRLERFMLALTPDQLVALEPRLRELQTPTMLVWGTDDQVFPLHLAEWLRDTIPGCRDLVRIEGGKLFWPFERGDELAPHLRRHWEHAVAA